MKKFDLEAAKNGAKLCTRDGRPARIVCYDAKGEYNIVALISSSQDNEDIICYTNEAKLCLSTANSSLDLFIVDNAFDFEAAKAGAPVCTKDGKDVKILCFDREDDNYPIVGLVSYGHESAVKTWTKEGKLSYNYSHFDGSDLIMK